MPPPRKDRLGNFNLAGEGSPSFATLGYRCSQLEVPRYLALRPPVPRLAVDRVADHHLVAGFSLLLAG